MKKRIVFFVTVLLVLAGTISFAQNFGRLKVRLLQLYTYSATEDFTAWFLPVQPMSFRYMFDAKGEGIMTVRVKIINPRTGRVLYKDSWEISDITPSEDYLGYYAGGYAETPVEPGVYILRIILATETFTKAIQTRFRVVG
jgi:hypothetical protein